MLRLNFANPINEALLGVFCLLFIQYTGNYLAYNQLLPTILGKDPNGVIKNTAYVVPGILAVVLSLYFEGKKGVSRIVKPYSIWKVHPIYWLYVLLIMFPLIYIGLVICDIYLQRGIQSHSPILLGWDYFAKYTPLFAQVAICDELFWIGFVMPRLVKGGWSTLKASFVISFLWGLDYIPYLFTDFYLAPGVNVYLLMLGSFATTPWYVWLYYRTGSALILLVFNIFIQYSQNIMPMLPQDTGGVFESFFSLLVIFIFGMLVWRLFPPPNKPANEALRL